MRPLVSLVMILRIEARSIRAVLEAARPHVDRYTIVVDAASADGTAEIAREVLSGLPGQVIELPMISVAATRGWRGLAQKFEEYPDYGSMRNRALDLDKKFLTLCGVDTGEAVFQLMLSGDEYLRGGEKLRGHLEAHRDSDVDCHFVDVVVEGEGAGLQPRVTRTGSAWRYEGEVHENLANRAAESTCACCGEERERHATLLGEDSREHTECRNAVGVKFQPTQAKTAAAPGVTVDHVVADPKARLENIWDRHIPYFKKLVDEEPDNTRALIFLARSYARCLEVFDFHPGERLSYTMEALSMYARRLLLPGAPLELNHCVLGYLQLARGVVYTNQELLARSEALLAADPRRADVAMLSAQIGRDLNQQRDPSMPMSRVYDLYRRAAEIAEKAAECVDDSVPRSPDAAWQAHYFAAALARQLAQKFPEERHDDGGWEDRRRAHVSAGLAAGGKWDAFKKVMAALPAPKSEQQESPPSGSAA